MNLPQVPLPIVVLIPFVFIYIVLFTNIRYALRPDDYISDSTVFASLVIGFIFLYAMQKYDIMDANVTTVARNLNYLKYIAEKYDPSLICYLIRYGEGFLDFEENNYSIIRFEERILPLIEDESIRYRVRESISLLETIYHERISKTNLIVEQLWYLIFITAILLTIIFPLDTSFVKPADSVIVIILIWLPIVTIYYLYISELNSLVNIMNKTIYGLERAYSKKNLQKHR
jgi:hypothetical protein